MGRKKGKKDKDKIWYESLRLAVKDRKVGSSGVAKLSDSKETVYGSEKQLRGNLNSFLYNQIEKFDGSFAVVTTREKTSPRSIYIEFQVYKIK
jgi:hypothetical protein